MKCIRPACSGLIQDGYCNVCGMPPDAQIPTPVSGQASRHQAQAPVTPGATSSDASWQGRGVPGTVPTLRPSGACPMPNCPGQIVDGYCDTCGAPAGARVAGTTSVTSRIGTVSLGSARAGQGAQRAKQNGLNHRGGHLGAGYTTIAPEPTVDPRSAILQNPEIPEDRRFCPHCGTEVGRSTEDSPGRLEGYCPSCRKPYSFTPKLSPGDVVAGQYEVRGCLAHGGMGWIYLAQDRNVSDRWVVLKGLLNAGDAASMQAAMAEQRFLAELQHPLIVEIYNFVTHEGGAYIVMEFVGGRSLKQILKDRMAVAGGSYDPLPVDQALAYVLEVLPAFSYLHDRQLLYCDFKPDNLMHVEDSVKLIDMGGVRRADDDESVIFGTVGFQAPEVASQGCSVASDIFTIGRTLLICCTEVKGYQTTYATSLPPPEQMPALAGHDSVYRLIAKACAANPSDRFSSAEELRYQMLGVLREVTALNRSTAAVTSVSSELFDPPTVVTDAFTWKQLPRLKPDPDDPAAVMLGSLDPNMPPKSRLQALTSSPMKTLEVLIASCLAAIEVGASSAVTTNVETILSRDPWEWRAAWIEGLAALNAGDWTLAQSCFNAVYGQIPGELAPKFALAVACEMGGESEVAERLYQTCATTDSAYVPGAAFGLARIRAKRTDATAKAGSVLAALDLVPTTSGGWAQSRRLAATYLTRSGTGLPDLAKAAEAIHASGANTDERLRLELELYRRALPMVPQPSARTARGQSIPQIGRIPATKTHIRTHIETILRQLAGMELNPTERVALIDQANALRRWTVI